MQGKDDILSMLQEKGSEATRGALRGVILQPGAIGDCILTLPLAEAMKEHLGLGGVDILGHTESIGIFPGRTCVDGVRSIDSADLHRLFAKADTFDLADGDPLINTFADYAWIATFMGEPDSDFEQNLIFTANCSHSVEIITLPMQPTKEFSEHITDFYIQEFITQSGLSLEPQVVKKGKSLIKATKADVTNGKELLKETGIDPSGRVTVIQPGGGGKHKCCHLDNFLAAAEELDSKDIKVVFLLGPAEMERFSGDEIKKITNAAKCLTDLSLADVLGLLSCADAFLGNDSGITHLAAAMRVKTVAIFGPTNPNIYKPIGQNVTVITHNDEDFAQKPSAKLQQQICEILLA